MWNPKQSAAPEEDDSWEERAFAEDTGNIMGTTWPPRSYTCTFCRREFRSAQALGGHMNVHRRDRAQLHQMPAAMNACIDSSSTLLSISPYLPNNLMPPRPPSINFPVAPPSINSAVCHSSNSPSASIDKDKNHNNSIKESAATEELDLELRLGCSSSPS
ncbi:hypothetical protein F0562_008008 [Nyssa sinensis]|uniref:C2H2-type domain-containing protein n=1 Tax=Nyssa sinensis TaxID=561372 RepID=A0A5J5A7P6_9ASTE|nr:hypothetical protein F0562_008008 [Nyssa sinensis]